MTGRYGNENLRKAHGANKKEKKRCVLHVLQRERGGFTLLFHVNGEIGRECDFLKRLANMTDKRKKSVQMFTHRSEERSFLNL